MLCVDLSKRPQFVLKVLLRFSAAIAIGLLVSRVKSVSCIRISEQCNFKAYTSLHAPYLMTRLRVTAQGASTRVTPCTQQQVNLTCSQAWLCNEWHTSPKR